MRFSHSDIQDSLYALKMDVIRAENIDEGTRKKIADSIYQISRNVAQIKATADLVSGLFLANPKVDDIVQKYGINEPQRSALITELSIEIKRLI